MPTEDAFSLWHLVQSHFETCKCSNVETNFSWLCITRNHSPCLLRWSCLQTSEGQRRSQFHLVRLKNSETPAMSSVHVWPSDHREDYRSCALPFNNLVHIIPKALHLTIKAVETIWRALSKHPQRRQGPDPRPFWLLVGTPSAFGPELAYRLRSTQPTLMDVTRYFWYSFILLYLSVYHIFDISTLVGCWSSVYIRRIIYTF